MKTINVLALYCVAFFGFTQAYAQSSNQNQQIGSARLVSNLLPAQGKHSTILNISKFGRYAVLVDSDQGTALQYVDRMAGPGDIAGIAGEQDGRLDLFLEHGDYQIITYAHESGTGQSKLSVHAFAELHANNIPQLVKLKNISLSLEDLQQRSFWLHIEKPETIAVEAAGRNLADLRLWKDGSWLLDIIPEAKTIVPDPDKPLQAMQINAKLQPGLYLLTAYGGPAQPWTEQSDDHPLHIRYGIPRLQETGQRRYTVSPFGTDRYLVPGNSNYFHLSVPEATAISITADTFREHDAFSPLGRTATITKKLIPPVAELELATQKSDRLISVTAMAGQSYILQHFEKRWRYSINEEGRYWLSSIHSGAAEDSVDATSVLTRRPWNQSERLMEARVIPLNRAHRYQRRFNLLDTLTLYLEIIERGNYIIQGQGEGVRAKYRIEPFMTSRPRDYEAPPFEDSGYKWDLDAGFYVLTVRPELKGVITLTVEKEGYLRFRDNSTTSVAGATRYGVVDLYRDSYYTLYLNQQPGVKAGVVLRPVPVDLSAALPVMQRANETVTIPVRVPEAGLVRALTTEGAALPLSLSANVGSALWKEHLNLSRGEYRVSVRNSGSTTVNYSLEFAAKRLSKSEPLPALPPKIKSAIPEFPGLTAARTEYYDLDRDQETTLSLNVDKPALYRLESTGLLETQGNLRTRTIPSLVKQNANGVGRNFLIQQYLREGDYQLTVEPRNKSRGHLGVSLARTAIEDGGRLTTEVAARATLKAGKGLLYRFTIPQKGKYRVRAIGAGRTYVMRLEDADGWPIERPNIAADITREFNVGDYRMVIRPEAVDARLVATLEAVAEPIRYEGHGPHRIEIDQSVEHEWREPQSGKTRRPDIWRFQLPAEAEVHIDLNNDMRGELVRRDSKTQDIIAVSTPVKPWQGTLAAGDYQLAVLNLRRNNLVNYQLKVSSRQLMVGQQRHVPVPASIAVAVGQKNLIELWSYGQNDVRARLYDKNGTLVAKGDDRSNDWNFFIAQKLPAGEYRLEVEAVGSDTQSTEVLMRSPDVRYGDAQSLPFNTTVNDTDAHVYPLPLPVTASLLIAQADSDDAVGLSLEAATGDLQHPNDWKEIAWHNGKHARLLVPVSPSGTQAYRLKIWSLDRRGAPISVQAQAVEPHRFREQATRASDITLQPVSAPTQTPPRFAVAAIELTRPGVMTAADADDVLWSAQPGLPLSESYNGLMAATGTTLWVARPIGENNAASKLIVKRVVLDQAMGDGRATDTLQLLAPASQTSQLDMGSAERPMLVIAESRTGLAGVQLVNTGLASDTPRDIRRFAVAQQSAVSVLLEPRSPVVNLWNAASIAAPLEVSVRRLLFTVDKSKTISSGEFEHALSTLTAIPLNLPRGMKRIGLVLPAQAAAVCLQGDTILSTHWSGKMPLNETAYSRADKILIFNAGAEALHFALSIATVDYMGSDSPETGSSLVPGRIFKRHVTNIGQLRIPVHLNADNTIIRIRGAARGTFLQSNGQIVQGRELAIRAPGELLINHQPGVIYAWLDSASIDKPHMPVPLLDVTTAQSIPLQGERTAFQVAATHGMQLLLRSDTPLISRIVYADGGEIVEAHPHSMNYAVYLPAGPNFVALESLGSSAMEGMAMISTLPIVPIQEGYGPQSMLSGGDTRMYGFEVKQQGPVGLGVQASADVVSGMLMDGAGNIISRGVVHMPELAPGHYVFSVTVPANSLPVRIRPALVGLERPPAGPPSEVIQHYLQQSGRKLDTPSDQ